MERLGIRAARMMVAMAQALGLAAGAGPVAAQASYTAHTLRLDEGAEQECGSGRRSGARGRKGARRGSSGTGVRRPDAGRRRR